MVYTIAAEVCGRVAFSLTICNVYCAPVAFRPFAAFPGKMDNAPQKGAVHMAARIAASQIDCRNAMLNGYLRIHTWAGKSAIICVIRG
jgi:hypothetical protein